MTQRSVNLGTPSLSPYKSTYGSNSLSQSTQKLSLLETFDFGKALEEVDPSTGIRISFFLFQKC